MTSSATASEFATWTTRNAEMRSTEIRSNEEEIIKYFLANQVLGSVMLVRALLAWYCL